MNLMTSDRAQGRKVFEMLQHGLAAGAGFCALLEDLTASEHWPNIATLVDMGNPG